MQLRLLPFLLLLITAAGCATVDEGPFRFSEGWRDAKVVEVLRGADVKKPRFWRCLRSVPEEERLSRTYVVGKYRGPHHRQEHLVPAAPGQAFRPGDAVHLNVATCENAIVKREERTP